MSPIGLPSVKPRTDQAQPTGLLGTLALAVCVLLHRLIGDYLLTFCKAFAGAAGLLVARCTDQRGSDNPESA